MPEVHVDARFPCGHMLHVQLRGYLFLPTGAVKLPDGECPLHGKNCKSPGLSDLFGAPPGPPSIPGMHHLGTIPLPPSLAAMLQQHVEGAMRMSAELKDKQPKA